MRTAVAILCVVFSIVTSIQCKGQIENWIFENNKQLEKVDNNVLRIVSTFDKPYKSFSICKNIDPGRMMNIKWSSHVKDLSDQGVIEVAIVWLNKDHQNIDQGRIALGFSEYNRTWSIASTSEGWVDFSSNIFAPDEAETVKISIRCNVYANAEIKDFQLLSGPIDFNESFDSKSGPIDAGVIDVPSKNIGFGKNLVKNPTLEVGNDKPMGWNWVGTTDKENAVWKTGGAYTGKRCFLIIDRGPYLNSWDNNEIYVPGSKPHVNYAMARSEVASRWVSDPTPAKPGAFYQASSMVWYGNRANRMDSNGNEPHPVRIQFLDENKQVIPYVSVWDDWMKDGRAILRDGWVWVPTQALQAPPKCHYVRAVVALLNNFYQKDSSSVKTRSMSRDFVLVDNISLYEVDQPDNKTTPMESFWKAAEKGHVPYLPMSRFYAGESDLEIDIKTDVPGSIFFVGKKSLDKNYNQCEFVVKNYVGSDRNLVAKIELLDSTFEMLQNYSFEVEVQGYRWGEVSFNIPQSLPYGPYVLRCSLFENNKEIIKTDKRISVMPDQNVAYNERCQIDYPFSLWTPYFNQYVGTSKEEEFGVALDISGCGKTWFGCGGRIDLDTFVKIQDKNLRNEKIDERVQIALKFSRLYKRYNVYPMGMFQLHATLDQSQYPILAETIERFVNNLKSEIKFWRYGTEYMHGKVTELDVAVHPDGQRNVQGGNGYLLWGRTGTARQYWEEYFVCYKAAKKSDPTCILGPQNASDIEGNVLKTFYKIGSNDLFDSFGMNTYISADAIWSPNIKVLKKHAATDKLLYISEYNPYNRTDPADKDWLNNEIKASVDMLKYWVYTLYKYPKLFHVEQYQLSHSNNAGDLLYHDAVRPQFLAFSTMTRMLGAGQFDDYYDLPHAEMYVRKQTYRKNYVAVAWSKSGDAKLQVRTKSPRILVTDLWGNSYEVDVLNNVTLINVNKSPVFITSVAEIAPEVGVQLSYLHLTQVKDKFFIACKMKNPSDKKISGILQVIPDSAILVNESSNKNVVLKAQSVAQVAFSVTPLEMSDSRLSFRFRFTSDDGVTVVELPCALNFHQADNDTIKIKIDGIIDEWEDGDFTILMNRNDQFSPMNSSEKWTSEDLHVRAAIKWDQKNLYFAFQIVDDQYCKCPPGEYEFNYDSIEILVDTDNNLTRNANYTMLTFAEYESRSMVKRYDGSLPKGEVAACQIATRRFSKATTLEAAVPWNEINSEFTPAAGKVISMAISIDDRDGINGQRTCISWFDMVHYKMPSKFGDVLLVNHK